MYLSILVVCALVYFIYEQFNYNTVRKINYYFLPIMSLIQCLNHFSASQYNLVLLMIILMISIAVGFFQAKYSKIREKKQARYYYKNEKGIEQTVYAKVVQVKGGHHYIIGWVIIFVTQLILQFVVTRAQISMGQIQKALGAELLEDFLSVYLVINLKDNASTWYVWALYGASTLAYTFFLAKRSKLVAEKLFSSKTEVS